MDNGISVDLPKTLRSVEEGRLAVLGYLAPFGIGDAIINRLEVVLEELVSNVVRHARDATQIRLSAMMRDDGVCLCIEDDGAAFDPLAEAGPTPFDRLEDAQIGGLGIPLIKRLSRSLAYERTDERNRVRAIIAV